MEAIAEPEWDFTEETEFLFEPHRYKVMYGGRGGVKSWSAARALLIQGYEQPLRILCVREIQKSIKDSVYQLLKDQISLMGLQGFYEVLSNEIRGKNGTTIVFTGLSNLNAVSIKSYEGIDRCWAEEANTITKRSWNILIPTIRKEGSEIWVTFNPELDTDDTYQRFVDDPPPNAVVRKLSWRQNPWRTSVLDEERHESERKVKLGKVTQEEHDNVWEGECKTSVEGAIYPREVKALKDSGRLCPVPYDPMLMVYVIYDIGWNDNMAISVVQRSPGAVRFIDYIEDNHRTYEFYINGIDADGNGPDVHGFKGIMDRPYAKKIKSMFLPHDGKAANPQTGKSDKEIVEGLLKDTGVKVDIVPDIGVKQGIEAVRQMFARIYMDKVNCTPLFNRLRRYKRVISPTTGVAGSPAHDENSHGADNVRYVAVVEKQLKNEEYDLKPIKYDNAGIV